MTEALALLAMIWILDARDGDPDLEPEELDDDDLAEPPAPSGIKSV